MSEPTRAGNIPSEAIWVEERQEFRVSALVDGLADGEVRWFRPDGTLAGVSVYRAGKGHGPYERFHQTGEWSQRGQQRDGNRDGICAWRRATGPTTEGTLPPSFPDTVREARTLYDRGLPAPNLYYDADGVEVTMAGEPVPPRPAGIDERAAPSDDGKWWFGWGAQDPKTREGSWRWWSLDGVLLHEQVFRAGKRIAEMINYPDGTPKTRTYKDARGWDLLQRCFDEEGQEVMAFGGDPIPPRPANLPETALFDSMKSRWIDGLDLSSLPPMGTLTVYELDGTKDEVLDFAGGHLRRRQHFNREGRLYSDDTNDERGNPVTEIAYYTGDGSLRHRIDRQFDGDELVAIDIDVGGGDRTMRGRKAEAGMAYEFFVDGALEARGTVAKNRAVGVWEFVEGGRTHTIDLTEHELRASVDEDFEPSWLLGAVLLEQDEFPEVPALAELEAVDWAETPSCYGENVENFPRYLRALVADSPAARQAAMSRISGETLHQGTIYVATARVIPFLLRLLDHPNADVLQILGYVESVTSQAWDYRNQVGDLDEDDDDRVAVLGTLAALEDGFAQVAPFVDSTTPAIVATVVALAARAGEPGRALLERAATQDNWVTAATAVHGLLTQQGDRLTAEAAAPWLEHRDPIVRFCAAIAAARLGAAAPPRTVAVLGEALEQAPALSPRFNELPFVKGTLVAYAALSLSHVRDAAAMAHTLDLARRLSDLDIFTLDTVSYSVLVLCFGDGTPPFAPDFIAALEAIAQCGSLENYANFSQSARRFGLPGRASAYRGLVEELRAAEDPVQHMAGLLNADDEDEDDGDEDDDEDEDDDDDDDDE
ncbi:MAG: hypothetical protein R3B06_26745 [Kofleriaceae bacterium]